MEGNSMMTPLMTEIQNLKVGETLTATGADFAAFNPSGTKEEDPNLGAYKVEITKLADNTFDLIVTSVVNGVNSVKHTIVEYSVEDGGNSPAALTPIFAATGYVPNDVFLEGGTYYADMFYDNELTILDAYTGTSDTVYGNLSVGGSMIVSKDGALIPKGDKPLTYAIRDTFTANTSSGVKFPSGTKSTVLIGGDLVMNANFGFENANVYVLGNLYVFGNGFTDTNSTYYVDGNVYISQNIGNKSSIYANGVYQFIPNGISLANFTTKQKQTNWLWSQEKGSYTETVEVDLPTGKAAGKWDDSVAKSNKVLDPDTMLAVLKEKTATNPYYKWVVNDSFPKKTITFQNGANESKLVSTYELTYSATEKGCEIDGIVISDAGGLQFTDHAIIIDTGDDPNNVYTIRVKGLYDLDGDSSNGKETFMWYPYPAYNSAVRMNVLVKGRGSVVIDVPEGVVYQDVNQVKFMHYDWWLLCGGRLVNKTYGGKSVQIYDIDGAGKWAGGDMEKTLTQFVHLNCNDSCGCEYSEKDSKSKCSIHTDKNLIEVHCTVHDCIKTLCPECFPSLVGPDDKGKPHDHTGDCRMRVGRKELDAYLADKESLKKLMLDKEGKIIYPTTNIYLVSCAESAEFRFSQFKANGVGIEGNAFFGYVYAPYMTFKGYGNNSGGGWVRMMGGMTVSDYILDDSYTTIACWPEKMPTDLMDEDSLKNQLAGVSGKSWKITPKRHG